MEQIGDLYKRQQSILKGFGGDAIALQKGKVLPVGTIKKRGPNNFIKTADGWKYHSRASKSGGGEARVDPTPRKPSVPDVVGKTTPPEPKKDTPMPSSATEAYKKKFNLKERFKTHMDLIEYMQSKEKYIHSAGDARRNELKEEYVKLGGKLNEPLPKVHSKVEVKTWGGASQNDMQSALKSGKIMGHPLADVEQNAINTVQFFSQPVIQKGLDQVNDTVDKGLGTDKFNVKATGYADAGNGMGTFKIDINDKNWRASSGKNVQVQYMSDGNKVVPLGLKQQLDDLYSRYKRDPDREVAAKYDTLASFAKAAGEKDVKSIDELRTQQRQFVSDVTSTIGGNWKSEGGNNFILETGDRGARTDHGGGNDGEGWMSPSQVAAAAAPFEKKHKYTVDSAKKALEKKGYNVNYANVEYGEKGHVYLSLNVDKK